MSSTVRLTRISWGLLTNCFYEHHKESIRWQYRCDHEIETVASKTLAPWQNVGARFLRGIATREVFDSAEMEKFLAAVRAALGNRPGPV